MTDTQLVLYTNPMSRGRIARWMLEEVGVPYETKVVAYGAAMKGPDYLALNPMGKVPTLRHGDVVVTECAAICAYLADAFPSAELAPPPAERGAYYRWLFFGAGPVEAAVTNEGLGFKIDTPQNEGRAGYGSMERVVNALVHAAEAAPFLAGERFTAADVYVGAQIGWGLQFDLMPAHPSLVAYAERARNRDAFRRATALDDALIA